MDLLVIVPYTCSKECLVTMLQAKGSQWVGQGSRGGGGGCSCKKHGEREII